MTQQYEYGGKNTQMFGKLPGYKKIVAWQAASDLSFEVNQLVRNFGTGHYELADQMRRSATSVGGNIAEGYCSGSLPNYIRYCNIARGSLGELGSYLQDSERMNLAKGDQLTKLIKLYGLATYFLDRLIPALIKKQNEGTWDKSFGVKEESAPYFTDADYDLDPNIIFPKDMLFT